MGRRELVERDGSLHAARAATIQARRDEIGLYQRNDPLRVLPFELRFLARHQPSDRWLVDLSTNDNTLVLSQAYPEIPLLEDRLFIPAEPLGNARCKLSASSCLITAGSILITTKCASYKTS